MRGLRAAVFLPALIGIDIAVAQVTVVEQETVFVAPSTTPPRSSNVAAKSAATLASPKPSGLIQPAPIIGAELAVSFSTFKPAATPSPEIAGLTHNSVSASMPYSQNGNTRYVLDRTTSTISAAAYSNLVSILGGNVLRETVFPDVDQVLQKGLLQVNNDIVADVKGTKTVKQQVTVYVDPNTVKQAQVDGNPAKGTITVKEQVTVYVDPTAPTPAMQNAAKGTVTVKEKVTMYVDPPGVRAGSQLVAAAMGEDQSQNQVMDEITKDVTHDITRFVTVYQPQPPSPLTGLIAPPLPYTSIASPHNSPTAHVSRVESASPIPSPVHVSPTPKQPSGSPTPIHSPEPEMPDVSPYTIFFQRPDQTATMAKRGEVSTYSLHREEVGVLTPREPKEHMDAYQRRWEEVYGEKNDSKKRSKVRGRLEWEWWW